MVKLLILLLFLALRSIAMGYHYEPYDDDIYGDHHKPSVFENRAVAWQGLRATEKRQREEYERARQKERDAAQSDYHSVIADLQTAITNYDIEKTKKCFEKLARIDLYDEFELWQENRPAMRLYIRNALCCACKSNQIPAAQQIVAQVRAFDQAHQIHL